MYEWKQTVQPGDQEERIARLLTPLQVLTLSKALAPLVKAARGLVPPGQHTCTVKVQDGTLGYLTVVSAPRKDTLLPVPYKAVATTALCRLNAATVASICKAAEDTVWKGETSSQVEEALEGASVARNKWRRGSVTVKVSEL